MGVWVNSAGSTTGAVAMAGTLTIKNANKDSRARIEYVCGKSKSSGTKKKLNYNYKEVSNQLLRAKKPQGAANALTKAKSRLATLQRYAATGEYDSKEISAAVAHARRMVECAQLKVRHLKQEEIENRKYKSENKSEVTQKKGEIKRRAANKERELKEKIAIEEIQNVQKEKAKRIEILTAFLQTTLLFLGLITFPDNMLLGLGIMLAANEVPRIAQQFGLDSSVKVNMMSVVHATTTAVNLTRTVAKAAGK